MSGVLSTLCSQERWSGFASSAWSLQNFLLCKGNCLSTRACRSLKTREIDDIDAAAPAVDQPVVLKRSEEHTSELQSLMRISYAVFCLKKKKKNMQHNNRSRYIDMNTIVNKSRDT